MFNPHRILLETVHRPIVQPLTFILSFQDMPSSSRKVHYASNVLQSFSFFLSLGHLST